MDKKPKLNIVLPVYNEQEELAEHTETLIRYLKSDLKDFTWIITIADNASTDKTLAVANKLAKKYSEVTALHMDQKVRGRAVKAAWLGTTADIHCYMDIDLSTDLKHLPGLVRSLIRGYDIAIGTRNAQGSRVYGRSLLRTITSKAYILMIKSIFFVQFSDAQCGFKALTNEAAKKILPLVKDDEWFFDSELLIIAEKLGFRIYEEHVTWIDNPGSTVRVVKTAQGDIEGLLRLFWQRPWRKVSV
jgi:glycosyltransferase involved in cell wall biosynthesis